ncbi:hypothetical protein L6452_13379 [Arctium lappa]|uniref:Uncharacterized protein n=1 Tax=Arctium lappa TaxID=4217 RepID=A0ACB9CI01_ARCLA|nr:hypothetical protein L6452_13379 [Arctium lappa]
MDCQYIGLRILLIEDEGSEREQHLSFLSENFCEVTMTTTTSLGLSLLENNFYDCLLIDVEKETPDNMINFIHEAMKLQPNSTIMMMITSEQLYSDPTLHVEISKNEAVTLVIKPVNTHKLSSMWTHLNRHMTRIGEREKKNRAVENAIVVSDMQQNRAVENAIVVGDMHQTVAQLRNRNAVQLDGKNYMGLGNDGKQCLWWTASLDERFKLALQILKATNAKKISPTDILREMNVTCIEPRQIKNHLKTYKDGGNKRRRTDGEGSSVAAGRNLDPPEMTDEEVQAYAAVIAGYLSEEDDAEEMQ